MSHPRQIAQIVLASLLLATVVVGCAGPLDRNEEQTLRASLMNSYRSYLQATAPGKVVELKRAPSEVVRELPPERRKQLDEMAGPHAYGNEPLELGPDLQGQSKPPIVHLSLEEAVQLAVKHNIDLQSASLSPAIAETQVVQAEAAFDATFFTTADWASRDTPQPGGNVPGLAGNQTSESFELTTGIRKPLTTGGQAQIQTTIARQEQNPSVFSTNRYYTTDVLLSITQPLLRNFGTDVNLAEVRLAHSARLAEREQLINNLLETVLSVEQAYWDLVLARHSLQVQTRLLDRTVEDRDRLQRRAGIRRQPRAHHRSQ